MLKKVLIICGLFYASPRIIALSKYLEEYGWLPTILTTPFGATPVQFQNNTAIIEVPYRDIASFWKRLVGLRHNESVLANFVHSHSIPKKSVLESIMYNLYICGGTLLAYPDELRSWQKPAEKKAISLLNNDKFDAIISSSFPVTSHRIAMNLTKHNSIPWISDLRDLWTQNHNYLYPWRKLLESRLEKKTLSNADMFSTVSESLALKLKNRYPNKVIRVINNGYDPDFINDPPIPVTKEFTITYTGLIYQGKQDPTRLFEALRSLFKEGHLDKDKVFVRYYGVIQKWLAQLIYHHDLEKNVTQYGPVSHELAVHKQRDSQLLLLHGWEDEYETGVLPLKMYEYFAARRTIIAIGGTRNEQFRSILDETKAGHHSIALADTKKLLLNYYQQYQKSGIVSYEGIPDQMAKYSHKRMAQKFANALNEIT